MLITDRVKIQSNRQYTDEGFLVSKARIARTGIQDYYAFELGLTDREPTDIVKIYRPEDEVFNDESMSSFKNKTITDNHPEEMVTAANAKKLSVGFSGDEVTRDGMFLETILHFTDADIITKIESGKVELSNGYFSDLEWAQGVTEDGIQYDAIQRNIRGNHIAVVDNGRCGASCRISDHKPLQQENPSMGTLVIDGVDYEVSDQVKQAVAKLQTRLADAEKKAEDAEEAMAKKKAEDEEGEEESKKKMDSMQAKLDDANSKIPTPEMLDQLVDNRIATRDAALAINPDFDWKDKDCEQIRKEIVADSCKDLDIESKSADYIRARFDMLAESHLNDSQKSLNDGLKKQVENKDEEKKELTGRDKFVAATRDAWKGGKK